jgi:hypothetical protein
MILKVLILVALLVVVASCGDPRPESFTAAKATAIANVHEAVAGAFPSGTYLEEFPPQDLNCSDSSGKLTGEVMAGVAFAAKIIDPSKNNQVFDKLKEWWSGHNWELADDSRPKDMFMNATRNGYLMSIRVGGDGRIVVGDTAPCVKGKGTL